MSGRSYKQRESTVWRSEWDVRPVRSQDFEDNDSVSQVSNDTWVEESNGSVKDRMRELFDRQLYTDVTFFMKNNDSSYISAHKAILAVGSPFFAEMLFNDQTSNHSGSKMEVRISNVEFEAFTSIVRYMYTDEVLFESDSMAQEILNAAKQFQIQSLVDRCNFFFENQPLTEENVCSKLQMSCTNKTDALKQRCIQYIQDNTYKVINSANFLSSNAATIRTICKLQTLNLRKELDLVEAVITWLNLQPPSIKQQSKESLLKSIRFLTINAGDITDLIRRNSDLMSAEDGLKILMYLNNPPKIPKYESLPAWCNKNIVNRCVYVQDIHCAQPRQSAEPSQDFQSKIIIPLKPSPSFQNINTLLSMLQITCIEGSHKILGMKLSFQHPVSERSVIKKLCIFVHVAPSGFNFRENIEVVNSLEVRIPFKRTILARKGDKIDFEVEAADIEFYKFLQFDVSTATPQNRHFTCCIRSKPSEGKLFFISEIEYRPQRPSHMRRRN